MNHKYLFVATCILAAGTAFGAEKSASGEKPLRFFEPYIGKWSWDGTLEEDFSFGKKGDVGTSSITWRWAYNKSAVDYQWEFDYAGKRSGAKGTIAWNATQKQFVVAGVFSDGGVIRGTGLATKPMTVRAEFIDPEGKATSQVETFTLGKNGTLSLRLTERKGGPTTADSLEYTFKRAARPEAKLPQARPAGFKQLEEYGAAVVGEWVGATTLTSEIPGIGKKGEQLKGTATTKWTLDNSAVQCDWTIGGAVGKWIAIWDAEKNVVRKCSITSAGAFSNGQLSKEGERWIENVEGATGDGAHFSGKAILTVTSDRNTCTWDETERLLANEKQPDFQHVWTRVKK